MTRLRHIVLLTAAALLAAACAQSAARAPAQAPAQAPAASAPAQPAAGEVYRVGLTAALTGPAAAGHAPNIDGLKAYLDQLNERGGVGGRQVELIALDDRAEPPRSTANAKRLVEDEKVLLLMAGTNSASFPPLISAAKEGSTPLLFAGSSVCPQEVFPPRPEPLLFCASFNVLSTDGEAMVQALDTLRAGRPAKLGLVAADIPISRQGVDLIEKPAVAAGMEIVTKLAMPVTTADYTPFATRFQEAGAEFAASWGPPEVGQGLFNALTKLGWAGPYISAATPTAEQDLVRLRQPNFYFIPSFAFTVDDLPAFRDVDQAAKKSGVTNAVDALTLGWVAGMTVEESLKLCGWPCDHAKLRGAMERVRVDTKGLFGGPIEWSPTNHVRNAMSYKLYHWDPARQRVVAAKDWFQVEIR
jgi:ABC-type branched-subunit amino acid transport system substrate-binding protein